MSMSPAETGVRPAGMEVPAGITFGPVPSRRFGRSLGINNIPPKVCTYSCVYCQVGRTATLSLERRVTYGAEAVVAAVRGSVEAARRSGERIDVLTFVPDGEPTLDRDLGETIDRLRPLGIGIAVITNGSLLYRADVRDALAGADQVSVKVDAVRPGAWRRINRPHRRLELSEVLEGIRAFASTYTGKVTTETMLVADVNDDAESLRDVAAFVGALNPATAWLAVPTRPPAERWVMVPSEAVLAGAYEIFRERCRQVELLIGYEGDAFASTGDAEQDLLSITAVHPMREGAVRQLLSARGVPWTAVTDLVARNLLVEVQYGGHRYFVRPVVRSRESANPAGAES